MSRFRAAAIHLALSIGVFLAASALLLLVWYPRPYFEAVGGQGLLALLAGVDVVLGPVITLTIFKSGKKGLKFDLIMIGFMQIAALIYGLSIILQARPAFVVFSDDRFVVISAFEADLKGAAAEFDHLPWTGPRLVALKMPDDAQERSQLLFEAFAGGQVEGIARYYRPYSESAETAIKNGQSLASLEAKRPEAQATISEFLNQHQLRREDVIYLPLQSSKQSMVMVLDKNDGQPVGGIAVDPW